jgi:hypothetical protein
VHSERKQIGAAAFGRPGGGREAETRTADGRPQARAGMAIAHAQLASRAEPSEAARASFTAQGARASRRLAYTLRAA